MQKKKFVDLDTYGEKTYYGVNCNGGFRLNGKDMTYNTIGEHGEAIREKINMDHFRIKNIEIDIYLDADKGIMRLKRVGFADNNRYEPEFRNINNCPENKNGWIPHFIFAWDDKTKQELRIAKIDKSSYGKHIDINW